jgi:DNA-binding transcriptional LysR family regulator
MLNISLRRLEVFVALAEAGGFGAAGMRLGIAQASVSAHIRALEDHLGLVLVERRRGRQGSLNAAGQQFLDHARRLLADAAVMRSAVAETREAGRVEVILACQRMVANTVIAPVIADFSRRHPRAQLVIRTLRQPEVFEELLGGSADIGCFLSNAPPPSLRAAVIGQLRLRLAVARQHPLAGIARLTPAALAPYPFIRAEQGSHLGRELDQLLLATGISRVSVAARTTEYQVAREVVLAGGAVMLALEPALRADLASGSLVALDMAAPPLMMDLCLALSQRRRDTPTARSLAECLRMALATGGATGA